MSLITYVKESYNELTNHVTWPTWEETQKLTVTVAVFSIIFALIIAGIDYVFSTAIENYFNWVKPQ
ncbi:preprotein translocase subunit SecE [Nonlabens dokdonensis]|uniref:Protein translocase subunit SecE n=1 Tax=Nonlabens dokdonensis TaxID=328515 RepID=A0A1Z8AGR2_9FLAO|nr:preprotein translocase subunit SecE [Nonlabens dokdonensis]OUS09523.1 preprotein translocase subunit SecE [Nonlabens dokdonensis]